MDQVKAALSKLSPAFWFALFLSVATVGLGSVYSHEFQEITTGVTKYISHTMGWFYLLLVTGTVCLAFFFIVSPIGQIRLGDPQSRPEHSTLSWLAMLFSAGMGIGLVFWGAAEPLSHYVIDPAIDEAGTTKALEDAFTYTFFHWGIHAWSVYGIVALALAYFKFRKKEDSLLSVTLKPLLYDKANGIIGQFVDSITIFATVIGVATTLGFGAVQINGGLHAVFGVPQSFAVQVIIIAVTTVLFILSALSGLGKGVKMLSNLNMMLAIALLACVIAIGPTVLIMNTFVDSIGAYLQNFMRMSFRAAALNKDYRSWIESWTIFYWAWWISWSPFVGIFIARISKGRTIREFLLAVILVPTLLSALWFTAFGTLSTHLQSMGIDLSKLPTETILFGTFSHYPLGQILSLVAIVLIFSFFITSADSATYVLGMLSEKGTLHPSKASKFVWGIFLSAIALILLMAGGLAGLQNILIIVALVFAFILLLVMCALYIELLHEKKEMGLSIRPTTYPRKDEPFRSYE